MRSFDIAAEDHEAAQQAFDYHLEVFSVDGETYAAVRPVGKAFSALLKDVYGVKGADPAAQFGIALNFLNLCFDADDLTAALLEQDEYVRYVDGSDEPVLTDDAAVLAESNRRLTARLMDRHDELGEMTLVNVMIGLTETWSGKDTGSLRVSSPRSSTTGKRSTGKPSSKASTRSTSTAGRRPASSARRTTG